ncbi:hypothetical protein [Actinokineospora sp. HUAS TT18]|uniref:hypothetical protein n=1 Tax=Actinokineospora sp. HUAS TT18 TaxID=3447451 RepID=UPI003F52071E
MLFQAVWGAVALVIGAVLSMSTSDSVALPVLPALSSPVPVADWSAPSPWSTTGAGQVSTPDNGSAQAKDTLTSWLVQVPGTYGVVAVTVGAVLSMLTATDAVSVLSALSVAVPPTDWFAPSPLSVRDADAVPSARQLLISESASEQVNDTVTSVLCQPNPFAGGVRDPLIDGLAVSRRTTTDAVGPTLPSASVAVPLTVWPGVSAETVVLPVTEPPPTPVPSLAVHDTTTVALFHPAAFAAGAREATAAGPVLSST